MSTCLYPHRNPATGAFCRSRNTVHVPSVYPHTPCAHHFGVMLMGQCEAEWPSPVTGGMTDARCVEPANVELDGGRYCQGCADEVTG